MTQEDKNLLLKDICARLPYRVIIKYKAVDSISRHTELTDSCIDYIRNIGFGWKECKPYLRPMSSMTEKEEEEYGFLLNDGGWGVSEGLLTNCIDWLNARHFDYRGLIEKGLAIEAPEGMYNN